MSFLVVQESQQMIFPERPGHMYYNYYEH